MRFQNGYNKVVIELRVLQFWSEIMLVISNRTRAARSCDFEITRMISDLTIYMKKLLDSDWLRAVQFKCNTSAKSVTPVQKYEAVLVSKLRLHFIVLILHFMLYFSHLMLN